LSSPRAAGDTFNKLESLINLREHFQKAIEQQRHGEMRQRLRLTDNAIEQALYES